jgi:hypothetical protein
MSVSFRRIVRSTAVAVPLAFMCQQLPAMAADSPEPVVAQAQCDQSTVAHSAMQRCVKHAADLVAQSAPKRTHDAPAPAPAPSHEAPAPAPSHEAPAAPAAPAPAPAPAPAKEAPAKEAPAAAPAQSTDGPVDAITHLDAAQLLDQLGITRALLELGIDVNQLPIDLHKVLEVKGLLDSLGLYQDLQTLGLSGLISQIGLMDILNTYLPDLLDQLGLGYLLKAPVPAIAG